MRRFLPTCGFLICTPSILAQTNFWTGTWQLNERLSPTPSVTFAIRIDTDGTQHIDNGTNKYEYRCDGKTYPMYADFSTQCKVASAQMEEAIVLKGGTLFSRRRREVSQDSQTLTITSWLPNRPEETKSTTYQRVSRGEGLGGAWLDKDAADHRQKTMTLTLRNGILHIAYPDTKQYTDAPLTGEDAPTHGLRNITTSIAVIPNGNRQLMFRLKQSNVLVRLVTMTLSPDGNHIDEETWRPEAPNVKSHEVFDKH